MPALSRPGGVHMCLLSWLHLSLSLSFLQALMQPTPVVSLAANVSDKHAALQDTSGQASSVDAVLLKLKQLAACYESGTNTVSAAAAGILPRPEAVAASPMPPVAVDAGVLAVAQSFTVPNTFAAEDTSSLDVAWARRGVQVCGKKATPIARSSVDLPCIPV